MKVIFQDKIPPALLGDAGVGVVRGLDLKRFTNIW